MKIQLNKIKYLLATVWLAVGSLFVAVPQALAASATLSLSPASTSVTNGSIVSLGIYVNSGSQPIYATQANLTYPANLLDYVSTSSSDIFGLEAQTSGGGGSVVIARGTGIDSSNQPIASTGNTLFATVRFKAKASAGTASVNFTSASNVPGDGGASILTGTSGATVVFTAPASSATKSSTKKTTTATAAAAPKDTTPPVISNVKATDTTKNSVSIIWTTSEPSTSEVSFGPTDNYGFPAAVSTSPVTEHKVVLDSVALQPGKTYHYVVKSVDPSGNTATGSDQTFKTSGYSLTVTVKDQNSKPVRSASINFQSQTVTTDKDGKATFSNLSLDSGNASITKGGNKTSEYINVTPITDNEAQAVTLKIKLSPTTSKTPILIFVGLFVLAVVVLWSLLRRSRNNGGGSGVITPAPVVTSADPDLKSAGPGISEFKPIPTPPVEDNQPVVIHPDGSSGSDSQLRN